MKHRIRTYKKLKEDVNLLKKFIDLLREREENLGVWE